MSEWRKLDELKPGPIRHPELPASLVGRIEALQLTLAEVYPQSIETWLDGFQRDANPEPEVVWWERLAQCYVEYSRRNELDVGQKMAAFKVILKLALGASEVDADLAELPDGALGTVPIFSSKSVQTIARLYHEMNGLFGLELYPIGVVPVPEKKIGGTAFFPGGCGLYLENDHRERVDFPVGGAMILGHNFDSEKGFDESRSRGKERLTTGTWASLLGLLKDAGVPPEECFFTNAFMGLCAGENSLHYRGRLDEAFRAACLSFLKQQIHIQRPRLILTLGLHVPPLLAEASTNLNEWTRPTLRLKDIDEFPIRFGAEFEMNNGAIHRAVVAALAHPSYPNNRSRIPNGFSDGRLGEVELIRVGWEQSRLH